jgi:hypothetical protein
MDSILTKTVDTQQDAVKRDAMVRVHPRTKFHGMLEKSTTRMGIHHQGFNLVTFVTFVTHEKR